MGGPGGGRGRLTVVDADQFLPRFMRGSMPDSPLFLGLAADVIGKARDGGRSIAKSLLLNLFVMAAGAVAGIVAVSVVAMVLLR